MFQTVFDKFVGRNVSKIFGQVFDQIVCQDFDQGLGEGKKPYIQYTVLLGLSQKHFKNFKNQ